MMENIRKHVKNIVCKVLVENDNSNLVLYHGSKSRKIYNTFYDNQFYTVNDYIASNYAYNFGGLMYEVQISNLNPFELKDYDEQKESEKHLQMINLLTHLYDKDVAMNYKKRYFTPSPSSTFGEYGWEPLILWCKENNYDSIKFNDESFDTAIRDTTYLIFNGNKPKIIGVYTVEEAVESNFSKEFNKIQ